MSGASGVAGAGAASGVRRPVAWQVGRTGEVAGGMTQVVNGYVAWPFERVDVRVIVSRDGSGGMRALQLFARAARRILSLSHTHDDIVVVHLSQGGSFVREGILLVLASLRRVTTVAQLHGSSFAAFAARKPRLVRFVLRRATRVMTLSDETSAVARRLVPPSRVIQLPNAVAAGSPTAKTRTVVFGGNVSHRKGIDVLMAAWAALTPQVREGWLMLVAGPVADPALVAELPDGVELLGSVAHIRLMGLLDEASVAVLPSRDEAMPMFILEALAREACVIATTVGGISGVLEGGAGILVDAGNVEALAVALTTALSDDRARVDTARLGHERYLGEFAATAVYPRVESEWLAARDGR